MHKYKANLLLATAALFKRARLRKPITRELDSQRTYAAFRAGKSSGRDSRIYLPLINRTTYVSILGVLQSTGAKQVRWLFNGQSSTGTTQILHYGDSGRCHLVLSRATVEAQLQVMYGENYRQVMSLSTFWPAEVAKAPTQSRLVLRTDGDEEEIIELPPDELNVTIHKALGGQIQHLTNTEGPRIKAALEKYPAIDLKIERIDENQYVLARPADLCLAMQQANHLHSHGIAVAC